MIRTWISQVRSFFLTTVDDDVEFCDQFREDKHEKVLGPPLTDEEAMTFVGAHPPPISEEQLWKELADKWGTWEDLVKKGLTKVVAPKPVLELTPEEKAWFKGQLPLDK